MVFEVLNAKITGCAVVHASPVSTVKVCVPVPMVNESLVAVEY
jgi:hypothetical protein